MAAIHLTSKHAVGPSGNMWVQGGHIIVTDTQWCEGMVAYAVAQAIEASNLGKYLGTLGVDMADIVVDTNTPARGYMYSDKTISPTPLFPELVLTAESTIQEVLVASKYLASFFEVDFLGILTMYADLCQRLFIPFDPSSVIIKAGPKYSSFSFDLKPQAEIFRRYQIMLLSDVAAAEAEYHNDPLYAASHKLCNALLKRSKERFHLVSPVRMPWSELNRHYPVAQVVALKYMIDSLDSTREGSTVTNHFSKE